MVVTNQLDLLSTYDRYPAVYWWLDLDLQHHAAATKTAGHAAEESLQLRVEPRTGSAVDEAGEHAKHGRKHRGARFDRLIVIDCHSRQPDLIAAFFLDWFIGWYLWGTISIFEAWLWPNVSLMRRANQSWPVMAQLILFCSYVRRGQNSWLYIV